MTVTDKAPNPPMSDDTEALFPEARQRRRRIRLTTGVLLLLVVVAAGLVYSLEGHGTPPKVARRAYTAGSYKILPSTIARATVAARTAQEAWRLFNSLPGCNPHPVGAGVIDLANQRMEVMVDESGCRSGNGSYIQQGQYQMIQVGHSLYETRQPQEVWPYGSTKTWLEQSATTLYWLVTADPIQVLNAVSSPMVRVDTSVITGEPTTEYRGAATLASVRAVTGTGEGGPIGTPDPPLTQIPIRITVWVDARDRVRQISTWEPLFTPGGPYDVSGASPTATLAGPPQQQGYVETVLDLWHFGTPVHISQPPAAMVASAQ